jgi:zinc transporter
MSITDYTYGTDQSGMVWGFHFKPDQPAVPMSSAEALIWQRDAHQITSDDFIWLHFNLSHASSEKWLRENANLPIEFYEALHQGSRSTRIELTDSSLIAVVNDVLHGFSFDPSELSTLWVNISPHVLISVRRKPLKSVDRLRQAVLNGVRLQSPIELLIHLLRDQADVLIGIVREAVEKADQIEDDFLAGRLNHKRINLGSLRRVLVRLQRLMAPEPTAMFRLLQRPPAWIADADVQDLRQSSEEFSAVLSDMASLQERIKLLQEEIAAMINEKNSRSLYTLTIVTVLALPINIIAGLFGMNVGGIPLATHVHGFWVVVAIVATFTAVAVWLLRRQQGES